MPRIRELGLTIPDPGLRYDETTDEWQHAEPDWDELRTVVTNHGPMSQERLEFRRLNREETRWVREAILAGRRGVSEPARTRSRSRGATAARPCLEPWEVFRQEKEGDPMRHGGSVMAPDADPGRPLRPGALRSTGRVVRLWVVRRADVHELEDPDLLQPPLDRSFKKPGGYVMRDKLGAAREQAGTTKPKASGGLSRR